jgi:hypothetical protein
VGADGGEPGAEVVDAGGDGGEGGEQVQPGGGQRQVHEGEGRDVEREEAPDRVDDAVVDDLAADAHRQLGVGMDQPADLAQALLDQQQEADDLDAAAGGAGAAADEGEEQQQDLDERRPVVELRRGEAGGGADGDGLEQALG